MSYNVPSRFESSEVTGMSLTILFTAATLMVPVPMTKPDGWTGQMVMLKRAGISFMVPSEGDKPEVSGNLMMIEYRVLADKGETLILVENGKEVTVRKDDMVLQSDAIAYYSEMIQKEPNDSTWYAFRGWANKQEKSLEGALADHSKAIELSPDQCAWRNNRALVWIDKKDYDKAIADYDESIRLFPTYSLAYRNRGGLWVKKKEYAKGLADFQKAIELQADVPFSHNSLARLLATCPDEKFRDGKQALEAAKRAVQLSATPVGAYFDTLAAAYAELGQFDEAIKYQEKAFADPVFMKEKEKVEEARERLKLYREKKPYREEPK